MNFTDLIGIGLRHQHFIEVIEKKPRIGWLEIHSENFFSQGGPAIQALLKTRELYPISLHGIGLSLGSADEVSRNHLANIKSLINRVSPFLVSEHLSWSRIAGKYMPDLLPIPYTKESLDIFAKNVSIAQDFLQIEILLENPSSYLEYEMTEMREIDFLVKLCQKTGAKILLDVNNVFVSCTNHGWNAIDYIDSIPKNLVKEIHIAGHSTKKIGNEEIICIDSHDRTVCDEVWDLYAYATQKFGPLHTLLEWDTELPDLRVLIKEASKALNYFPIYENRYAEA